MKKEWKSNNYNNVRQIVEAHTHMSAEEFLYPQKDPYLHGLKEAVQFVKACFGNFRRISSPRKTSKTIFRRIWVINEDH